METPYLFRVNDRDRRALFEAAQEATGWPSYVLEKDYHVTLVLRVLFEELKPRYQKADIPTPFLFKGGTTLSKVFECITRMSEDIDLSLHRDFLGHPEPEEVSRSQFDKYLKRLNDSAQETIRSNLQPALEEQLKRFHPDFSVEIINDGMDMEVLYPQTMATQENFSGYIKPRVLVECGGRAGFEPHARHTISPMALSALGISDDQCQVEVLGCDRTFFEKLTAVHEINNRAQAEMTERQSRHLYDLVSINNEFPQYIDNRDLLAAVVEHKKLYFRRSSANWEQAVPGTLTILPRGVVKEQFREDWSKMEDMFPGGLPYTFDELMRQVGAIEKRVNAL